MTNRAWLPTVAAAGLIWPRPLRRPAARAIRSPQLPAPPPPVAAAPAPAPVPQPPPPDPITVLIDASQQRFLAGERELRLGHLEQARESSSTARSRCCWSRPTAPGPTPGCASTSIGWSIASTPTRSPPSRRATVSRRKRSEPASIDELLQDRDVPEACGRRRHRKGRQAPTSRPPNTTCPFRRTSASWRMSSSSRGGCATTSTRA